MRVDKSLVLLLLGVVGICLWAVGPAHAVDPRVLTGVPQPSAQPTCAANGAGIYGDPNGCLYSCADGKHAILTRSLSAGACVFPTTTATATPTPTATSTP